MAYEYPMWTPHEKAKLYKRYTADVDVTMREEEPEDSTPPDQDFLPVKEVITIQDNRYVYRSSFKWVEVTDDSNMSNQPISGLILDNSYLTIRTNSRQKFNTGDIVMLPKSSQFAGAWIIDDGRTIEFTYTPKQVQTYQTLPLSNLG